MFIIHYFIYIFLSSQSLSVKSYAKNAGFIYTNLKSFFVQQGQKGESVLHRLAATHVQQHYCKMCQICIQPILPLSKPNPHL